MRLTNDAEPLDGRTEINDACRGNRLGGRRGRGSLGERPIVIEE